MYANFLQLAKQFDLDQYAGEGKEPGPQAQETPVQDQTPASQQGEGWQSVISMLSPAVKPPEQQNAPPSPGRESEEVEMDRRIQAVFDEEPRSSPVSGELSRGEEDVRTPLKSVVSQGKESTPLTAAMDLTRGASLLATSLASTAGF